MNNIDENKLDENILNELNKENVKIMPYNDIYEFVKTIDVSEKVLVDESKVNYAILNNIPSEIEKINEMTASMSLMLLSYMYAFHDIEYAYAAASSMVLSLIIIVFTIGYFALLKYLNKGEK